MPRPNPKIPCSLHAARELIRANRPTAKAPRQQWIDYYTTCANIFQRVATTDPHHHHEALGEAATAREWGTKLTTGTESVDPDRYYAP
ncbi:AMED_5909 family protein [Actinokineospora enzanensis]|uniref:AMED_5909 family protein n=1 Tax=Actinokineospora enzanensis TaxID=155975 RepID=UPI0003616407|nr:AMED_5909 family protein [Actinokineospora enzanensis]